MKNSWFLTSINNFGGYIAILNTKFKFGRKTIEVFSKQWHFPIMNVRRQAAATLGGEGGWQWMSVNGKMPQALLPVDGSAAPACPCGGDGKMDASE